MEQALRIQPEDEAEARVEPPRSASEAMSEGIEKVLRFAIPSKPADGEPAKGAGAGPAAGPVTAREFAAAIDGVHEARQAMKAAEERTREAEARTHAVAQRAAEELRAAESRIQALEARIRAAESRAEDAETRAKEADAWLRQIFATIAQELPVRKQG